MQLYQHLLLDEKGVHVADLLPELSTRRLLTMTWLEGAPLLDFVRQNATVKQRNAVAMNMFRCWYVPFYRSEEHTSELQSLMRISYAVFCLKKKNHNETT